MPIFWLQLMAIHSYNVSVFSGYGMFGQCKKLTKLHLAEFSMACRWHLRKMSSQFATQIQLHFIRQKRTIIVLCLFPGAEQPFSYQSKTNKPLEKYRKIPKLVLFYNPPLQSPLLLLVSFTSLVHRIEYIKHLFQVIGD